jgi:hypothetical protein
MIKTIRIYIYFAGVLLLITAIAKLVSSSGSARVLENADPIFGITFRHIFWLVGALELIVALVCFFWKQLELQVGLITWLVTSFLIYRLGLMWVGYHKPCSCLGNLMDMLHISPQTADTAMKIVLGYLLIGSYAALFWLWKEKRKARFTPPSSTEATKSAP